MKGKKVLHIDRNDHYGGYVFESIFGSSIDAFLVKLLPSI